MSGIQSSSASFLDDTVRWAAAGGKLTDTIRQQLQEDLEKGMNQLVGSLFPDRIFFAEDVERLFQFVRLIVGKGMFLASDGSIPVAWEKLLSERLFSLSRRGCEFLLPYVIRYRVAEAENILDDHSLRRFVRFSKNASLLEVYKFFVSDHLHNGSTPEKLLSEVLAKAEKNDFFYRLTEARFKVFSAHGVDFSLHNLEVFDIGIVTAQILLHRWRCGENWSKTVNITENLKAFFAFRGKLPFDDEEWQTSHLPEIADQEIRKKFCEGSAKLDRLPASAAVEDARYHADIWSGDGFPGQLETTRLIDFLFPSISPNQEFLSEEKIGAVLIGFALGDDSPQYPKSSEEQNALLVRLLDKDLDWSKAYRWLIHLDIPETDREKITHWARETLEKETLRVAEELRNARKRKRAMDKAFASAKNWLRELTMES